MFHFKLLELATNMGPFAVLGSITAVALVGLGMIAVLDVKAAWTSEVLEGFTGMQEWRARLNGITNSFVKLGSEKLLAKVASRTEDPLLNKYAGKTLATYKRIKDAYLAVSFGYAALSRCIQHCEGVLSVKGVWKLVRVRDALRIAETPLRVTECNVSWFTEAVKPPQSTPEAPAFLPGYLSEALEALIGKINTWTKQIQDAPAQVESKRASAEQSLANCRRLYEELRMNGTTYGAFEDRVTGIELTSGQIAAVAQADPLGALDRSAELDQQIASLRKELEQAGKWLATIVTAGNNLTAQMAWVAEVRATALQCPWNDEAQQTCWLLKSADSNPDGLFAEAHDLIEQAKSALTSGNFSQVEADCTSANQKVAAVKTRVQAQFNAKASVDSKVPALRGQLTSLREDLAKATEGMGQSESDMAQLVTRACRAVEDRIGVIHSLYQDQRFADALAQLTGSEVNEHGMPIAKLMEQAKELLSLLKQAQKTAATVKAQLA